MGEHTDEAGWNCPECRRQHQRCLDDWAKLTEDVRRGKTFHGPEAHHPHRES